MIKYRNTTNLNIDCLPTDVSDFSQVTRSYTSKLPKPLLEISQIIDNSVSIEIVSSKIVPSPIGTSAEGLTLTGKSLIVIVDITVKYNYISSTLDSNVHSFSDTFTALVPISLSTKYNPHFDINTNVFIEDLYYSLESPRCIYSSVTFLVAAEQMLVGGGC